MTKQEILDEFSDINYVYNNSSMYETLSLMLDELLKEQGTIKGHWIPNKSPTGVDAFCVKEMTVQDVRCSVCNSEEDVSFSEYKFCPRCGAKMG